MVGEELGFRLQISERTSLDVPNNNDKKKRKMFEAEHYEEIAKRQKKDNLELSETQSMDEEITLQIPKEILDNNIETVVQLIKHRMNCINPKLNLLLLEAIQIHNPFTLMYHLPSISPLLLVLLSFQESFTPIRSTS